MSIIGSLNPGLLGSLSAENAVARFRELLHCEARTAGLRPDAITISANLYDPDGGIDAQVEATESLPEDTFLRVGRNGFQLKTGASFKPWQKSSLRGELFNKDGQLNPEVKRTLETNGHYFIVCFGLDLTPEQRNDSADLIAELFLEADFPDTRSRVAVYGQCQIASYFERYPSLRLSLLGESDEDFLTVSEWSQHAHMSNPVMLSEEQKALVDSIRQELLGDVKHIRVLGEPGIGKTRLVLEAVRIEAISAITLYVQNGSKFSQTALFRELLRETTKHPLVLVLDELSEREMSEIWGHLKNRCGDLKLISLDHGPTRSRDTEITIISAPHLPDQTIKLILESHVGEGYDLDRWISICEGSPRVAQAIGENLAANPDDILQSPATVPIWDRFLFGYAHQQSDEARQVALVMRHISLFSRFGFEDPVGDEAKYIASLVAGSDSAVSWARFQEIVQSLRERRILQGTRTLFIVPWALHIHLWREYWNCYGRGFDFSGEFEAMPESLHGWFMDMFQYAHGTNAAAVVRDVLRPDGIFSDKAFFCSDKGSSFLSTLAEADPEATIGLIEQILGQWSREELFEFKDSRQRIVWALEKIAVWKPTFVRAVKMLARLALAENAEYSNNSTGTLLGLFRIGPEWAATETSPEERFSAFLEMIGSDHEDVKRLGLKVSEAALSTFGGMRTVGPEYQGLKDRANLWKPETYGEWWGEYKLYWDKLVSETRLWDDSLRKEANTTILKVAGEQLRIETNRDDVLSKIELIAEDSATDINQLNTFFIQRKSWHREEDAGPVLQRLRKLEGRVTRRNIVARFQRYVLNTSWDEWENHQLEEEVQERLRPRKLVRALAKRVTDSDENFGVLLPKLSEENSKTGALFFFGQAICEFDRKYKRLKQLLAFSSGSLSSQCLGGYLAELRTRNSAKWQSVLLGLLSDQETAERGAELVGRCGFDDRVLDECIHALEMGWIGAGYFHHLCWGMSWQSVPQEMVVHLCEILSGRKDQLSAHVLVDLLDQALKSNDWLVESEFVLRVVSAPPHFEERLDTMHSYHWRNVCQKLVEHDPSKALPLLDVILTQMSSNYHLSYSHDVAPLAHSLCQVDPEEAWVVVAGQLLSIAPKWRGDLFQWLNGGIGGFDDKISVPPIAEFPVQVIVDWIEQDADSRASMIAHCAPRSLYDEYGGELTRRLLSNYQSIDGVASAISCIFHSGGWRGPRSEYLRKKREKFRRWLAIGFDTRVNAWIENELMYMDTEIESAEISEEREPWNRP